MAHQAKENAPPGLSNEAQDGLSFALAFGQHPVSEQAQSSCRTKIQDALNQQHQLGSLQHPFCGGFFHNFGISGAKHGNQSIEQSNGEDEGENDKQDKDEGSKDFAARGVSNTGFCNATQNSMRENSSLSRLSKIHGGVTKQPLIRVQKGHVVVQDNVPVNL
jgi:hypothetical protein